MIYILGAVAVLVIWVIVMYNSLISLVNRTKEAWSDIDVQLKRRYDLIPNLIATVKGYAVHESKVFEKVTEARSKAMQAGSMKEKQTAENDLSGTLKSLFAISESYPDLKANQNFLALQTELSDTENKIQAARRFYNGNVRDLNTKLEVFPSNVIAGMFKFERQEFFDLGDANAVAREPVAVKF
ncbi:MAG: LemA family protein [Candidatus Pacebacteria bacterium]|nr:LemA family protein [Candidatus Paceibacterota bacterium]